MKLAVVGAGGRMGLAVVRLAALAGDVTVVGAAEAPGSPHLGRDAGELAGIGPVGTVLTAELGDALLGAEVCVDFSSKAALPRVAAAVGRAGVAWVCGTTGLDAADEAKLDEAARGVPVLHAANMSLGVQVLAELAREAVKKLGPGFDVEIVETHHRKKADAPSGTAKRLADAVREARAGLRDVTGRAGLVGARQDDELAILALRGGDVIGDHTVHILGPGERLELTHRATSRDLFAGGALRAARFLAGKQAGRYVIADVVGRA